MSDLEKIVIPDIVKQRLEQPLDADRIKQRDGRGGGKFAYLETHDVKRTMNAIFGFDGWGYTIVTQEEITAVEVQKDNRDGWHVGYRCIVRVHVKGFPDTDGSGYGDAVEYGQAARVTACELALKESESDALKRACTKLGDQLGLGLYEKDAAQAAERRVEKPPPDPPPTSWQGKNGIRERLEGGSDTPDVWNLFLAFARAASVHLWGEEKPSTTERKNVHLQKASTVCVWLMEEVEPNPVGGYDFGEATMRRAWARVVEGHALTIPDYVAPEPEPSEIDDQAEALADQAIVGPSE